ncbi:hypothetical protein NAC44_20430 [Allorhizobium sp. BGMRC 0089]|uniref:hypothetical protein n=1 Tax=Allorhizobium sonneratiae TaxID=2934936 RepID=UPI0020348508|nr:hypothetical protein [Allorhizobium sonneratiae]MCM2294698.1 hypothetical protein [Allorhizobium sonneratiae]
MTVATLTENAVLVDATFFKAVVNLDDLLLVQCLSRGDHNYAAKEVVKFVERLNAYSELVFDLVQSGALPDTYDWQSDFVSFMKTHIRMTKKCWKAFANCTPTDGHFSDHSLKRRNEQRWEIGMRRRSELSGHFTEAMNRLRSFVVCTNDERSQIEVVQPPKQSLLRRLLAAIILPVPAANHLVKSPQ